MRDSGFTKARLTHPSAAIRAGEVEPSVRLDKHVQARQQPVKIHAALIVVQMLINDQRAVLRQGVVGFPEQHVFLVEVPAVQDMPHYEHMRARHRILHEIAGVESQPLLKTE